MIDSGLDTVLKYFSWNFALGATENSFLSLLRFFLSLPEYENADYSHFKCMASE